VTKQKSVDQKSPVDFFDRLERIRDNLRAGGTVVSTWRSYKGQRLGPYFRLAYRVGGRQKSVFIGRDVELAENVRNYLRTLQHQRNKNSNLNRMRRVAAKQFAVSRKQFGTELAAVGLRLRGSQVIGWRAWRRHQGTFGPKKTISHESKGLPNEVQSQHS
jgi:hypothetical protein